MRAGVLATQTVYDKDTMAEKANYKAAFAMLDALGSLDIRVGLDRPEGSATKVALRDEGTKLEVSDISVATAAYYNEYGTTKIPARAAWRQAANHDFMRRAIHSMKRKFRAKSDDTSIRTVAEEFALIVAKRLIGMIEIWSAPANAAWTVADKGFNDPLVATGQTIRSISTVVKVRGKRTKTFASGR